MHNIFAIGDSHSIFFHNSSIIKEHWLGLSNMPITLYRLINEKLDIFNIGNILGNGHEKYNICRNDFVIFFYGYNDIQKNISKYHNKDYEKELENLIGQYIFYIIEIKNNLNIKPIISCIYPNPHIENNNISGTPKERKIYTIYANNMLKNYVMIQIYYF